MSEKEKERVFIDVYHSEDGGHDIYQLKSYGNVLRTWKEYGPADVTSNGGFFLDSDELDEFLEDHADKIEVVEDFRTGMD